MQPAGELDPQRDEPLTRGELTAAREPLRTFVGGRGKPMLLIPGFGVTPRAYQKTLDVIVTDHQVFVPWLAGKSGRWTIDNLLESLLATIESHGLKRVWLVGHSYGGAVAIALAARQPKTFRALTLVDSLGASPGVVQMAVLGMNPSNFRLLTYTTAREIAMYAAARPLELANIMWWAYRCDLSDAIREIRAQQLPRNVVCARDDKLLPPSLAGRLAAALDAPLTVVGSEITGSRTLHDWPMRYPEAFARILRETAPAG